MEGTRMTTQAVITDQRAGVYRSANREYDVALELMPPDRYVLTTTTGSVRREGFDGERTILESRELPAESPWTRRETNFSFLERSTVRSREWRLCSLPRDQRPPGLVTRGVGT
jgi:hypothetical protein